MTSAEPIVRQLSETASPPAAYEPERAAEAWRLRLTPFMMAMIVLGSLFFAGVGVAQMQSLDRQLGRAAVHVVPPRPSGLQQSEQGYRQDVAAALEQSVVARRYEFAVATLRVRLWTRMLGFSAGMVLAMVGAAFVLGRLQESQSQLSAQGAALSVSMTSASPGLILAVLGAGLMALSIAVAPNVTTSDGAIYWMEPAPADSAEPPGSSLPPPTPLGQ
ncbi:hypothetical protein CFHF_07990 [Caulobacter flavus]|uniref:MotA/TolQ/ExbB proton channel domain-containing protein n=1 Tax=Caulobacter flavus TaxID=1679497 RepID=A0A2N5CVB8_9CAUL|nr:hypothetical protein [Caulobacter flavus]AYV46850.1 hypothetical protein C1707_11575 [Caulobacter flavus]PLR17758.1 hypothetical protein CFHF_07990 [Caulobacter flavus]